MADPAPAADDLEWEQKRSDLYTFVECAVDLVAVAKRLDRTKEQTIAALAKAWEIE